MMATAEDQISNNIAGRVAVIVGAAGGMGRAISARLAAAGCQLALIDLESASLEDLAHQSGLKDALLYAADISDRAQVEDCAQAVRERFGRADILINAAGINTRERNLADMSAEQWERVVAVNLTGAFHLTQAFLELLRCSGVGVIVNIVSTAAVLISAVPGTAYSAAKRALLSLTESTNIEQGKYGIRACALVPGEVDTPIINQRAEKPSPERRAAMLQPEDIAEAVYYIITRPARVTISELRIWPSAQIAGIHEV